MKTSFTFNEKTSAYAYDDVDYNRAYVKLQETDINMILRHRGYMYLNQIYEAFGVEWNYKWKNILYTYKPDGRQIELIIVGRNENGFDIDIL